MEESREEEKSELSQRLDSIEERLNQLEGAFGKLGDVLICKDRMIRHLSDLVYDLERGDRSY